MTTSNSAPPRTAIDFPIAFALGRFTLRTRLSTICVAGLSTSIRLNRQWVEWVQRVGEFHILTLDWIKCNQSDLAESSRLCSFKPLIVPALRLVAEYPHPVD